MSPRGSIDKLQKSGARLYAKLSQCFSENGLIRQVWHEMARGKELQAATLRALPAKFWIELKKQDVALEESIRHSLARVKNSDRLSLSMQGSFAWMLEFEEPVILKIYAPIIRYLRTGWKDHALDFYILVKTDVTRIARVIQSFSGDPDLKQRAAVLQQDFDKGVQVIEIQPVARARRAKQKAAVANRPREARRAASKPARAASVKKSPLSQRIKPVQSRAKRLVKKIELPRRRARR